MANPVPKPQPGQQADVASALPPVVELGALGWLRRNLFSSVSNTLLTLVCALVLYVVISSIVSWSITTAKWDAVAINLKLFMIGAYPHLWRIWTVILLVSLFSGLSWGAWGNFSRGSAVGIAAGLLSLQLLPLDMDSRIWILAAFALIIAGLPLGIAIRRHRNWLIPTWVALFAVSLLMITGSNHLAFLPKVPTGLWNGLMLNMLLAISGIVFCFPLGVLLALGRQSNLPAIRIVSIGYIELIRAVPLITILFMAQLMVPLFMPEQVRLDNVLRAFLGITLFSAAYMAENVRGGLQVVPRGQIEAAKALGLRGWQTILFIQLPQALRAVIPAIVGQFISLLKDTSLVYIVSLTELVTIGKTVLAQPGFVARQMEVYSFVAIVFFILSYSLSIAGRRLEKALGVGER